VAEKEGALVGRFAERVPQRADTDAMPVQLRVSEEGDGALTVALDAPWSFLEEEEGVGAQFFPERGSVWAATVGGAAGAEIVFRAPKAVEGSIGGVVVVSGRNERTEKSAVFNVAISGEKD
jgi:hypothetical protein